MKSTLLFAPALLLVGFGAGYWVHSRLAPSPRHAASATADSSRAAPAEAPTPIASAKDSSAGSPASREEPAASPYQKRAEAIRWLTDAGLLIGFSSFTREAPSPGLIKLLDLTTTESAQLVAALRQAKTSVETLRAANVTTQTSPDGKKLVMQVPALDPGQSGVIYDRFTSELEATLGPERMALFRQLDGEKTERAFDRFGLNARRYEVRLESVASPRGPVYEYESFYADADGRSHGSSKSTATLDDIRKQEPVIAGILSATLGNGAGP